MTGLLQVLDSCVQRFHRRFAPGRGGRAGRSGGGFKGAMEWKRIHKQLEVIPQNMLDILTSHDPPPSHDRGFPSPSQLGFMESEPSSPKIRSDLPFGPGLRLVGAGGPVRRGCLGRRSDERSRLLRPVRTAEPCGGDRTTQMDLRGVKLHAKEKEHTSYNICHISVYVDLDVPTVQHFQPFQLTKPAERIQKAPFCVVGRSRYICACV